MDHLGIIILLYIAGVLLLVAELMLPSHGILTLGALACLGVAVYQTFQRDMTAGIVGTGVCLIMVPTILLVGIKYIRYLPMGDLMAPPNPTREDVGAAFDSSEIEALIGQTGRTVSQLRPVGICEFNNKRIQCVAESGMIDRNTAVIAVGLHLNNLMVRPHVDRGAAT